MSSLGEVLSSKPVEAGRKDGKRYLIYLMGASTSPSMSDLAIVDVTLEQTEFHLVQDNHSCIQNFGLVELCI